MMRIGIGYDVHRLVKNRPLILGGVEVPFDKGLLGHSDADVLIHALMDALLGAVAKGDIGKHFPDSDEKYRGISSLALLGKVVQILKQEGYAVVNVDTIIIAQRPKLLPFIQKMTQNIASSLGIEGNAVNVKATTTEGLGFAGQEEGIAAQAVALVRKLTPEEA